MTDDSNTSDADVASAEEESTDQSVEAALRLELDVKIESPSSCERQVLVTIPREDVDRYFDKAYSEMMGSVSLPGFRKGRIPRKLIESRFRKDASDQVKGALLMDSISQVTSEHSLSAIGEPEFDVDAIEVPEAGPMTYRFRLEVRPEFDTPNWKGLTIKRPTRTFSEKDVDLASKYLLEQQGKLVPKEGAASSGDYIVCNLSFKYGDQPLSKSEEETIRLRPVLSFRDGKIEKFDKLMSGVKAGESREGSAILSDDAPNESMRGKQVTAVFDVLEVKQVEMPEMTPEFLMEIGGFTSLQEFRDFVRTLLERRLKYSQHQRIRKEILDVLTKDAKWDLPQQLLRKQANRELQRMVLELRSAGFDENEIVRRENSLRRNSLSGVARALKEHFILERIAEDESITDTEEDYAAEIDQIAEQSDESPRRVRARLEKRNQMDVLRNQIIERKTIEMISSHAQFEDIPYEMELLAESEEEALSQSAAGGDEDEEIAIPTAQPDKGKSSLESSSQ